MHPESGDVKGFGPKLHPQPFGKTKRCEIQPHLREDVLTLRCAHFRAHLRFQHHLIPRWCFYVLLQNLGGIMGRINFGPFGFYDEDARIERYRQSERNRRNEESAHHTRAAQIAWCASPEYEQYRSRVKKEKEESHARWKHKIETYNTRIAMFLERVGNPLKGLPKIVKVRDKVIYFDGCTNISKIITWQDEHSLSIREVDVNQICLLRSKGRTVREGINFLERQGYINLDKRFIPLVIDRCDFDPYGDFGFSVCFGGTLVKPWIGVIHVPYKKLPGGEMHGDVFPSECLTKDLAATTNACYGNELFAVLKK